MTQRVVDFLRSSNDSLSSSIKASVQRRTSPSTTPRNSRSRERSYASSIDEGAAEQTQPLHPPATPAKMSELAKEKPKDVHTHHRLSFPILHIGGSKTQKDQAQQHPNASLDWKVESPPVVMHGDVENSTGALVSGQLLLCVKENDFEVDSFEAKLDIRVTQKKPFTGHCHSCSTQTTELKSWSFLSEPSVLSKRIHEFPFSVLLEGYLPATTDNPILSVRYDFTAEAKPRIGPPIRLVKTIDVKRSLPVPELPHHSVRIFPPTNLAASVHYSQIVHPISAEKFTLRLDGIVKHNPEAKSVEYWKLKRLSWKLEENLETVAPACEKHSPKEPETGAPSKKGIKRADTRTIAHADLHSGWKSDYSPSGNIEMEVEYQVPPVPKAACDMKSLDGTEITHQLVVEMVVVQEYAPTAHPKHITPTGVARILRMHFGVVITERAGLGVSWDNEAPPIYQDVPPSPPAYTCDIPYENVDDLTLGRRSHEEIGGQSSTSAYEGRASSM
ncbi:hypothetical protein F4779DRAFT_243166 [Xylariaceae sp. FL0662B]|nr:hypothetical protein F4779DRAFT_243166 [Xylariaceae sp. FL0662B]